MPFYKCKHSDQRFGYHVPFHWLTQPCNWNEVFHGLVSTVRSALVVNIHYFLHNLEALA